MAIKAQRMNIEEWFFHWSFIAHSLFMFIGMKAPIVSQKAPIVSKQTQNLSGKPPIVSKEAASENLGWDEKEAMGQGAIGKRTVQNGAGGMQRDALLGMSMSERWPHCMYSSFKVARSTFSLGRSHFYQGNKIITVHKLVWGS